MVSAGRPQGTVMENVANGLHLTTISVGCGKKSTQLLVHFHLSCSISLIPECPGVGRSDPNGPSSFVHLFLDVWDRIIFFFLVGYVEERLWWPIKSPNIGGKKKRAA